MLFGVGLLTRAGPFGLGCVHPKRHMFAMGFHSSRIFVGEYFEFFHRYLQWAFGQLVVMFEITSFKILL